MKVIVAILIVVLYFTNTKIVQYCYPDLGTDYDSFVKAYYLRLKIYEVMFCLCFYIGMVSTTKLLKSIFVFAFMLCAASCFDKWILELRTYLITDIIVIIGALITSYAVYKKEKYVGQS